jgi:DNA-binding response OmpR family regulator
LLIDSWLNENPYNRRMTFIMNKKVLVADDEKVVTDLIKLFFENAGFTVTTAFSGKEALSALDKDSPEVVIIDLGLPDINGFEVIKKIRKEIPHTIVIVITGFCDDASENKIRELGVEKYIKKPFGIQELLEDVKTMVT